MGAQGHRNRGAINGWAALLAVLAGLLGLGLLVDAPLIGVVYGGVLAFAALAGLALRW